MIHISIPNTQTLVEADGNRKYDAFDIYINGAYHASIRYSHLLKLHEKLREHFGPKLKTPDFPSRKLFRTLDQKSLNERRMALARYFQADVFMADGTKETVRCNVEHPTEIILKRFADIIGMSIENIGNFGLFLAKRRYATDDGHFIPSNGSTKYPDTLCVRLLRNFESPYLSIHLLNQKSAAMGVFYFVVIRKLVWDPRVEEEIMDDPGAVLLLYKQAVSDLHNGHFVPRQPEIKERLLALEEKGNCIQFLRLCHLEPTYSYEVLEPCLCDYPRQKTECDLKVGRRHILLEFKDEENKLLRAEFRATRIRVWRIAQQETGEFTFQFEYLMSKDQFQWITLYTNQAILLSLLLQSIGLEILKEHRMLVATFGGRDYDYPTKSVFNINCSQNSSVIQSPIISTANEHSLQTVNFERKNIRDGDDDDGEDEHEGSETTNSDPLTSNIQSNSGSSIRSFEISNGNCLDRQHSSNSIADNSNESIRDLFTTISKALSSRNEAFEITDDDL